MVVLRARSPRSCPFRQPSSRFVTVANRMDSAAAGRALRHAASAHRPRQAAKSAGIDNDSIATGLRVGTIILRSRVERHLSGPLYDRAETSRWEAAVTRMIREGHFKP